MLGMSDSAPTAINTYSYLLMIVPPAVEGGSYHLAIRKRGKLHQRSDRGFRSKASARQNGMEQIELLLQTT